MIIDYINLCFFCHAFHLFGARNSASRPILPVPKQYSFETVCFKKQGLSASTAGRTRQFAGINHQSRWQGKACLRWPAKKSCELNGILIDFLFSMSDFAALGLSQLCSFKIKHGGKNVSFFRENSKLWLISFEKHCLHWSHISMSIKRRILNC